MIDKVLSVPEGSQIQAVTGVVQASPIEHLGGNRTEAQKFTLSDSTGSVDCTMWKPGFSKIDLTQYNGQTITIAATGQYGEITAKSFRDKTSLNVGNKVSIVVSGESSAPPAANPAPAQPSGPAPTPVAAQGNFEAPGLRYSKAAEIAVQLAKDAQVIADTIPHDGSVVVVIWKTLYESIVNGKVEYDG